MKKKTDKILVAVLMDPDMLAQLKALAKLEDRNFSETVRHIIKTALAKGK